MTEDVSMKNTKKEMLDIIHQLHQKLKEQEQSKLNPEKVKEETKKTETIAKADQTVATDLVTQIHTLKLSINKELTTLSQKIQAEAEQYTNLNLAIAIKQAELETLYGIEKEAAKLATILEAQQQTREKFATEMEEKRTLLSRELNEKQEKLENIIAETKKGWEREKIAYQEALTEEKEKNTKERIREQEEYDYQIKRSRELAQNRFNDEMEQAEKELKEEQKVFAQFQEEKTTELNEREKQVADREQVMDELQGRVNAFPEELQKSIDAAVQAAEKHAKEYAGHKESILNKTFEGEKNVLQTKITALESLVHDQAKQIDKLIVQQEKAYQQVQDIASKAVAGATDRPQNITFRAAENE